MDDEKRTPEGGSENNELKDIEAHHDDARPSSPDDEVAQQTHLDRDHPTHDPDVVDWDGSSDVQNPRNWATWKKLTNVGVIVFMTLLTPLASSMFAPAVPQVLEEFHNHADAIPELVVSIYILGFGIGPLIISPLSEIYGRWPVYFVTNILFMVL
jgi:Na+/melibiose symporter-like transporter